MRWDKMGNRKAFLVFALRYGSNVGRFNNSMAQNVIELYLVIWRFKKTEILARWSRKQT
jgi:hypothetical protein